MLYRLQNNIFICCMIIFGLMACKLYQRAFDLITLGSLTAFVSQMALLLFFAKEERIVYSEKTLFFVVFLYSLMVGTIFMTVSYIYEGDTFLFSKADAMLYYEGSIRAYNVGFLENMAIIIRNWDFEDWGAFCFDSLLMSIIPDKLFLNFAYMLLGALSSVLLYRIGRHYMPDVYSFLGALAYGTSSFVIFFHCTFLKESLFVTIVICAMYNICKFFHKESNSASIGIVIFVGILFFFRPAVAAFIIMSCSIYYAVKLHGSALSLFIFLGVAVVFFVALQSMMNLADRYSSSAEVKLMESGNDKAYSGGFNTFVNLFGGFCGPFPTIFTKLGGTPSPIQFYASGLTYKLFLILPFGTGIFCVFKNKVLELFPLVFFILVEMFACGMIVASLELRKVMPHIPLIYIISFYGLSKWQETWMNRRLPEVLIFCLAIGILFLWNIVKTT